MILGAIIYNCILAMRTILITGSSRGIGLGLVKTFLDKYSDVKVIAACRNPAGSSDLMKLVEANSERLLIFPLDTTLKTSHESLKASLLNSGINSIDILIANAGISNPAHPVDPILSCSETDMMDVYRTNVVGTMFTLQAFTPLLLSGTSKIALLLSSRLASIEQTAGVGGYTSYRASKAAMNMVGMTYSEDPTVKSAGIKVLCMHPGWVQTDMGGSGGRKAPVSVINSTAGILNMIERAVKVQLGNYVPQDDEEEPLEFERFFSEQRCVFTAYDGEILPW